MALKILTLLGWCLAARSFAEYFFDGCAKCEEELCPNTREECQHGLVHDPCGCCRDGVCVLAELDKCFNPESGTASMRKYGTCGDYMECVARKDLRPNDRPESLCICKHSELVCGTDNITYSSVCEMRAAKADLLHYGPCLTRPIIVSGPEATNTYEGSTFALDCEARGFPVPSISWEFQSFTGLMATLPGDDPTIIVHSRGGPENYMLTSWVQIEFLRKNDSGRYICVAKNSEGEDRSVASIHVSVYNL